MNYRHIYHAGNFADVIKHITLITLIQKLKEKDKPFALLDAFAGLGLYDLAGEEASKTGESFSGVQMLLGNSKEMPPPIIAEYLRIIEMQGGLYPGSPMIAASILRDCDRLIAAELHPADYATLRHNMRLHKNVHVHHVDAYNAIKAFCPFSEKRGLVMLDPAFEVKDEFEKILEAMHLIKKRFAGGIVMIWYPIKDRQIVDKFYRNYKEIGYVESLQIEFEIKSPQGMNRCGIIIANPPYVEEGLRGAMDYLSLAMEGRYYMKSIVG